jgi:hypothetical protein
MTGEKRLLLFIPALLFLHNVEEALTMPQWMEVHLPLLTERIPLFRLLSFSSRQLYVSLFQVTLIPFIVSLFCLLGVLMPRKVTVMLILQSVIFWNALMPHVSGTILLTMYNPGTLTAVVFNIPFSVFLYRKFLGSRTLQADHLKKIILAGGVLYLPLVYTNHLLAMVISNLF